MLRSDFPCWLKVVDQKFLCRFFWESQFLKAVFCCFFGFQLEAGWVSKNDGLPYCFWCCCGLRVLLVCADCVLCASVFLLRSVCVELVFEAVYIYA
jgi:hypothetical protein